MAHSEDYLKKVERAHSDAGRTSNAEMRVILLKLARQWEALAADELRKQRSAD